MPETCENLAQSLNRPIYYTHQSCQTHEICQVLPDNLTQWISKLPESSKIKQVREYFINVVLFGINDMQKYKMTAKIKSNLYVRPVNIFPEFSHWVPSNL